MSVQNVVQRFYVVAADGIFHSPDIAQNIVCCNIFGINHTSQIQFLHNIVKGNAGDLGNQLGIGVFLGKQRQQNVFLITLYRGHKGLCLGQSLLKQQLFICTVTADDGSFRQKLA